MKRYVIALFFSILLTSTIHINANTNTYNLKAISCKMAECYHPQNGFVFKSTPKEIAFSNDSFNIDLVRSTFRWKDNKDASIYKIYDVQKITSGFTFKTEHHFVRLIKTTGNNVILGMIISVNNNWVYLEYKCTQF